jgi:hypothetical protein
MDAKFVKFPGDPDFVLHGESDSFALRPVS